MAVQRPIVCKKEFLLYFINGSTLENINILYQWGTHGIIFILCQWGYTGIMMKEKYLHNFFSSFFSFLSTIKNLYTFRLFQLRNKKFLKTIFKTLHQSRSKDFNQIGKKIGEKFDQIFGFGLQSEFVSWLLKIQHQTISLSK